METRTVALHRSMQQIADVVNGHPGLSACAAESTAFEQFVAVIADLEALRAEQCAAPLELRELRVRRRSLINEINLAIEAIVATAALTPTHVAPLPSLSPPPTKVHPDVYSANATAIVNTAAAHSAELVKYGLHPRTFDDARALIAQLIEVDFQYSHAEVHFRSFPERLKLAVDAARKRRRQLYLELRRAMTPEVRAEWNQARSLGRIHRPRELPAAPERKLLAAPKDSAASASVAETARQGIKQLARQVVSRIAERRP